MIQLQYLTQIIYGSKVPELGDKKEILVQVCGLKENIDFQTAWGTYLKMSASGSYIPLGKDSKNRTAYSEEEGVPAAYLFSLIGKLEAELSKCLTHVMQRWR